jgi:hypothetical protein
VERSHQRTKLLKGYDDTVIRAEALEKELDKSEKHSALLQSKLDSAFAQYHNKVKDMQAKRDDLIKKNKTLHPKNKGLPAAANVECLFVVPVCSMTLLTSCLQISRILSTDLRLLRWTSRTSCTGRPTAKR